MKLLAQRPVRPGKRLADAEEAVGVRKQAVHDPLKPAVLNFGFYRGALEDLTRAETAVDRLPEDERDGRDGDAARGECVSGDSVGQKAKGQS